MVLVDPKVLHQQKQQVDFSLPPIPNPLTELLKRLDHDMDNILKSDGVSLPDKLTQYNQVLIDYLNKTREYRTSHQKQIVPQNRPQALTSTPSNSDAKPLSVAAPSDTVDTGGYGVEDYTKLIATRYQPKAKRLISFISQVPGVSWTARGELKVGDKVHQNSHMVDLITHAVKPQNPLSRGVTSPVAGWSAFAQVLKAANIPHNLVSQSMQKEWLKRKTTPGTPPTSDENDLEAEHLADSEDEADFGTARLFEEGALGKPSSSVTRKRKRTLQPLRKTRELRWSKY